MNIENDDDDDDGNGWMKAGLPELGAPHFFSYQSVKMLYEEEHHSFRTSLNTHTYLRKWRNEW